MGDLEVRSSCVFVRGPMGQLFTAMPSFSCSMHGDCLGQAIKAPP